MAPSPRLDDEREITRPVRLAAPDGSVDPDGHAVVQPYRGTHYVVVSHVVLDAMRAAGLTGFTAKRARMV